MKPALTAALGALAAAVLAGAPPAAGADCREAKAAGAATCRSLCPEGAEWDHCRALCDLPLLRCCARDPDLCGAWARRSQIDALVCEAVYCTERLAARSSDAYARCRRDCAAKDPDG